MPPAARILTLVFLAAIFAVAARQLRASPALQPLPSAIPQEWARGAAAPRAWIFVRSGCVHCETHLASLWRAIGRCEASRRQKLLERIHVVGESPRVPAGVPREPDRLRRALGVRTTPTTLFADPDGQVRQAWRGARGVRAWERALGFLDEQAVPP